jgi:hypothetical protein
MGKQQIPSAVTRRVEHSALDHRSPVTDQVQLPQLGSWELMGECGQEGTVLRSDARPGDLPLQYGRLVARRQCLDVIVHE